MDKNSPTNYLPPIRDSRDRKSTRLNSSHLVISYAVFCLKKKIDKLTELPLQLNALSVSNQITSIRAHESDHRIPLIDQPSGIRLDATRLHPHRARLADAM